MGTLIKIAWRNVWRNKLRSLTVIVAIVLGLWAGLFTMALTLGLNEQRMDGAVNSYLSHVQGHHPGFMESFSVKDSIDGTTELLEAIHNHPLVKSYSSRTVIAGMGATAHGSVGLQVIGIDTEKEKRLTTIHSSIIDDHYFTQIKSKPVVIGSALADKLKLELKKKLYITFVDKEGYQQKIKLKVEGIFKTSSSLFDEASIFMKQEDLQGAIGQPGIAHEIAILCHSIDNAGKLKSDLAGSSSVKFETWADIAPELGYANEIMTQVIFIFMGIILIALSFGIINTMLMAVLERKRELGMLMSVGMNKAKVFFMILFETLFISMVSAPIGVLLSYWVISYFGQHGIDLSVVGEGLESLGVGTRVYTHLPETLYFNITVMTLFVAFLSSLWPARRALKLDPAEAVRAL